MFSAKIGCDNLPSLQLFKKKLCFVEVQQLYSSVCVIIVFLHFHTTQVSRSEVFNEVTLELIVTQEISSEFKSFAKAAKWIQYRK